MTREEQREELYKDKILSNIIEALKLEYPLGDIKAYSSNKIIKLWERL